MQNIRIVLVETSHPGNIGAVARAMKNMCLTELILVNPKRFPDDEAEARSSGATDILSSARVVNSLEEAVGDCTLVIGASARQRATDIWQELDPRQCAGVCLKQSEQSPVALVFGRESSGLTSAELDRCTHLMHIPSNPDYTSLNIAMAVQVMAYELRMASQAPVSQAAESVVIPAVTVEKMEGLFAHLQQALQDIGFIHSEQDGKMMQKLRRFFHRACPDEKEINILRGMLSAAQGAKSMRSDASKKHS